MDIECYLKKINSVLENEPEMAVCAWVDIVIHNQNIDHDAMEKTLEYVIEYSTCEEEQPKAFEDLYNNLDNPNVIWALETLLQYDFYPDNVPIDPIIKNNRDDVLSVVKNCYDSSNINNAFDRNILYDMIKDKNYNEASFNNLLLILKNIGYNFNIIPEGQDVSLLNYCNDGIDIEKYLKVIVSVLIFFGIINRNTDSPNSDEDDDLVNSNDYSLAASLFALFIGMTAVFYFVL